MCNVAPLLISSVGFVSISQDDARSFSAYLGLGSARAMQGDLAGAAKDFTLAIKHGPAVAECWKRRGQTLQALGRRVEAIHDLRKTVECMEEVRAGQGGERDRC